MRTTTLALAAALTTCLASPLTAQEAAPAPAQVLIVASFVCPMTTVADIARDYETYTKPVEQELVAEGALAGAGLYFHAFADEWNVNHYRLGYDIGDMLDAMQTVNRRVVERNPEREGGPARSRPARHTRTTSTDSGRARDDRTCSPKRTGGTERSAGSGVVDGPGASAQARRGRRHPAPAGHVRRLDEAPARLYVG